MYNDFVLIGPKSDKAQIGATSGAAESLQKIADAQATYVSRGDDSGTHKAELKVWQIAERDASYIWLLVQRRRGRDGSRLEHRVCPQCIHPVGSGELAKFQEQGRFGAAVFGRSSAVQPVRISTGQSGKASDCAV